MAKKIKIVGQPAERVREVGRALPRIEPEEFAAAIGAEPCGPRLSGNLDPISLAELGNALLKQLRSTGGRPALEGATERCKVPLAPADVAALEQIIAAIEQQTGSKPSLGQITSVIVRTHLDLVRNTTATTPDESRRVSETLAEPTPSLKAVEQLVENHLRPIREELELLKKDLASRRSQ